MIFRSYVSLSEGNLLNLRLTYDLHGKYLKSCPTRVVTILGWPHYKPPTKSAFRNYTGEQKHWLYRLRVFCSGNGQWNGGWQTWQFGPVTIYPELAAGTCSAQATACDTHGNAERGNAELCWDCPLNGDYLVEIYIYIKIMNQWTRVFLFFFPPLSLSNHVIDWNCNLKKHLCHHCLLKIAANRCK